MSDLFELPVTYKGEMIFFPAELLQTGYTHKFRVEVYGQEVLFEPDEEQNYRALVSPDSPDEQIDIELLKAIAGAIEAVLK